MIQVPVDLSDEVAVRKYLTQLSTEIDALKRKKQPLILNISGDVKKEDINKLVDYINKNLM
jgi:hypothetical protein